MGTRYAAEPEWRRFVTLASTIGIFIVSARLGMGGDEADVHDA